MGYVGNQTTTAFTSMAKQDITGDGGTGYTLDHAVANAQEIEVFVNNVRQEPGVAYTVSGTALTMTGNVASTDNFYVVYQGKAVATTNHPSTQPLNATTGTFTGDLTVDTNTLHVDAANNRVGVGTLTPADHLAVVTSGANAQLSVDRSDGATGRTVLIHSTSGGQLQTTGSVPLIFGTADTERGRFLSGGGLTFNGDTATANAISDYEEGYFNPTIATSGANVAYSNQNGVYTKVGRAVHFNFQINVGTVTSQGSGDFILGGLPFSQGTNDNFGRFNVQTNAVNFNSTYTFFAYPSGGVALRILGMADNSGWHVFSTSDFSISNGSIITVAGTYFT